MSSHEIHTLTGAYATDALDGDERQGFSAHLEQCEPCRQEVAELAATTARLGAAVAAPAPPALRSRVLAEAARTRQLAPVVSGIPRRGRRPWYREPLGVAASLLLVLAVGLAGLASNENRRADRAEQTAARIAAVATDPNRAESSRPVTSGGDGTLISASGQAIFRARGLHGLPSDRTYQLWILNAAGAHSVGVLGRGSSGSVAHFVDRVEPTDRVGLTIEPSGGSKRPTTRPVVVLATSA